MESTHDDYVKFLTDVAGAIGMKDLTPDEGGLVSMRVDEGYTVNLQHVRETSRILCFIEVMALPSEAGAVVYRDLLVGSLFGRDTAGGFFGIEPSGNNVVYHYLFDFAPGKTEVADFVETLEKILSLVDGWHDRMKAALIQTDEIDQTSLAGGASGPFMRV